MYVGDFALGKTFDVKFCTVNTSGVPTTLAGTPTVAAYPDNSLTEVTAGITLTVDFDARTGLHNVRVVATGGNGYLTATNYALVITAGTVGGSSVVGYVIGHFSIEARSALRPATADRTADVDALGGVEIGSFQAGALTSAAFAAGAINAAAVADGTIDAATFAAGAINAAAIASAAITAAKFGVDAIDAAAFAQAAADKVFGASGAVLPELAQAIPAATPSPRAALMLLYMALRNRLQVTATEKRVTNDALTVIAKKALTDDGTTYQEEEMVSGP